MIAVPGMPLLQRDAGRSGQQQFEIVGRSDAVRILLADDLTLLG